MHHLIEIELSKCGQVEDIKLKVMVLDQGKIAEFDGPNALLEDKNSIFHGMAKAANIGWVTETLGEPPMN
ncbi:hypothetical protein AM593_04054, partial [Mytilus galloprovincialis]